MRPYERRPRMNRFVRRPTLTASRAWRYIFARRVYRQREAAPMVRVTPPTSDQATSTTTPILVPRNRRKSYAFATPKRVVAINRLLAGYLVVLIVFDVLLGRRADVLLDAVISMPLALVLL